MQLTKGNNQVCSNRGELNRTDAPLQHAETREKQKQCGRVPFPNTLSHIGGVGWGQVDMDYTPLEEVMKAGKWRQADDMTRAMLITLAGEDAEVRAGWDCSLLLLCVCLHAHQRPC